MANELMIPGGDNKVALPAHIQARFGGEPSNIVTGDRLPTLSIKGKVFTVTAEGETWPMMKTDEEGNETPVGSLPVVILDYAVKMSRSYYEGEYDAADTKGPKCYSNDGVAPEDDSEEKQSDRCATCPMAAKGSKVTPQGKPTTACGQNRLLAVIPHKRLDLKPLRLRIAVTSNYDGRSPDLKAKGFYAFQNYLDFLKSRGLTDTRSVVTTLSFDPSAAYPKLLFKAKQFVSVSDITAIDAIMDAGGVDAILGRYGTSSKDAAPAIAAAPKAAALPAPKDHPADVALAKAGAKNPALTPKAGTDAAAVATAGAFVPPEMEDGEDEDDYQDRVTAARRAHKAKAAELAKLAANVNALPKPGAAFVPPAQEEDEDEDDYADRVTAARRAHKAAQAKPAAAAAPVAFVPPEQEDGEDEDDYADRVTAARRAHKAAQGGAPVVSKTGPATAPAAAAPAAEAPARKRRTKAEMEAARAAEAAVKAAPVEAEEVPAGQEKAAERFIPGALSGADLGDDDDGPGIDAAPVAAAPKAAAPKPGAKAGAAPGPKKGVEAPAVSGDVAGLLESWDD